MLMIAPCIAYTRIIHVPGDSTSIQGGINGTAEGDTVLVEEGEYFELINFMGKGILVTSSYIFNSDSSSIYQTVINGDSIQTGGGSVVNFNNGEDSTSVLCGFTIKNGVGTYIEEGIYEGYVGGGIYGFNASPIIIHNIIRDNVVDARPIEGNLARGGGIYFEGGSPQIIENLIIYNTAYYYLYPFLYGEGGGTYLINCLYASVMRNNILYNESGADAAGVTVIDSWVTIKDNEISYNRERSGILCSGWDLLYLPAYIHNNRIIANELYGIVVSQKCYAEIRGNLIALNNHGSGIGTGGFSDIDIYNNTIVANGFGNDLIGGGITGSDSRMDIRNNIIVQNNGYGIESIFPNDDTYINHNDVWGNTEGQYYHYQPGPNDISNNPQFVNPSNGVFALQASSPCIDAGDPDFEVPEGGGDRIDMGAIENEQPYQGFLSFENMPEYEETGKPIIWEYILTNPLQEPLAIDIWLEFSGPMCGVARKFLDISIPPGTTSGSVSYIIPHWAIPGFYTIKGRVGNFGEEIWDSEVFDLLVVDGTKQAKVVFH